MDWVGVVVVAAVLLVGIAGGLLHRRRDGRFRDVSAARRRIAELADAAGQPPLRRSAPEAAAAAAAAASSAAAAAVSPAPGGPPPRALRLVKDGDEADAAGDVKVIPDARVEPGVVDKGADGDRVDQRLLDRLGVAPAQATLLQFSSAFCAPCRAVRRISSEVAALLPGVQHVEVDAESHLDEVRELGIWRTPTLLLLDAEGRVVKRATGVPSKPQLIAALADVLPVTG